MLIGKGYVVGGDLFDIGKRLEEIDSGYFIFYNYQRKRYEVHHKQQRGNSLAFIVPFDKLDNRTLIHARKTAAARKDALIKEMQEENERLERKSKQNQISNALSKLDI